MWCEKHGRGGQQGLQCKGHKPLLSFSPSVGTVNRAGDAWLCAEGVRALVRLMAITNAHQCKAHPQAINTQHTAWQCCPSYVVSRSASNRCSACTHAAAAPAAVLEQYIQRHTIQGIA